MRTAFRIMAGIIGIPFIVMAILVLLLICSALSVALAIPCLAIWLVFVMPVLLILGCVRFAVDDSTDGFKAIWNSFVMFADPTRGFHDVLIPVIREIFEMMTDMCGEFKKIYAARRRAKSEIL